MLELSVMAQSRWNKIISVLGTHVHSLAIGSCQQVQYGIIARGEKLHWKAYFYLTHRYHSNNSSATPHDVVSNKIAWFTHLRTTVYGSILKIDSTKKVLGSYREQLLIVPA